MTSNHAEDPATPQFDSPTLTLVQPTEEENIGQTQKNSTSWAGALTADAYLRREAHLNKQELTRDLGLTPWVLTSNAVDKSQRKVLAGCESIRKRALVAVNGQVKDVICHGVCSVFVPPEYRSKRYGYRMIQELAQKLDKWQAEETSCVFSVLYSDIGKNFYSKHGWHPYPSSHVHLPPNATFSHPPATISVKLLHSAEIPALCTRDEALVRARFAKYANDSSHSKNAAVALIPDAPTFAWHQAREDFIASELYKGKTPTVRGALAELSGGRRVWALWMRSFYNPDTTKSENNTLHVQRIVIDDGEGSENSTAPIDDATKQEHIAGLVAVLRVAQREAAQWNMAEVEVWNPDEVILAAVKQIAPQAVVQDREMESIASLKWYGDADVKEVEWLENDKFAWC